MLYLITTNTTHKNLRGNAKKFSQGEPYLNEASSLQILKRKQTTHFEQQTLTTCIFYFITFLEKI